MADLADLDRFIADLRAEFQQIDECFHPDDPDAAGSSSVSSNPRLASDSGGYRRPYPHRQASPTLVVRGGSWGQPRF